MTLQGGYDLLHTSIVTAGVWEHTTATAICGWSRWHAGAVERCPHVCAIAQAIHDWVRSVDYEAAPPTHYTGFRGMSAHTPD